MFRILLAAAALLAPLSAHAQTASQGFCDSYVQSFSSGDACPDCRLTFLDAGTATFVQSNTGWSAELTAVNGDETAASGTGSWGNVGDEYAGQIFDIALARAGETLELLLTHRTPDLPENISAIYVCAD